MVTGDAVGDGIVDVSAGAITALGKIGLWLQALGIIVILWIIFQVITFFLNRKRMLEVYKIKHDMVRVEGKIDSILKKLRK